jgi:eukaryotic-like serine/threonine-protein kinase
LPKHTILFLAANPVGTDRHALDEEARAVHGELERSGHRDQFELVTRWAAQPLDLLRELRKLKPTIVHFSGHGGRGKPGRSPRNTVLGRDVIVNGEADTDGGDGDEEGLFFQGTLGQPQLVSTEALEETFRAAGASVRLVVLSACYSSAQAKALLASVDCVVGNAGLVSDDETRSFAIGFYGGLAEGETVANAYRQGRAAIRLEALRESDLWQLVVRDGIDPDAYVLAAELAARVTAANAVGATNAPAVRKVARDPIALLYIPGTKLGEATGDEAAPRPDLRTLFSSVAAVGRLDSYSRHTPAPAYPSAEVRALSEQLDGARLRKQALRDAALATDEVNLEILELRRTLREGGQLRAGDALGDGRYLLVKQLGRGGFAIVWEAYDREEQRSVAIKVLYSHLAGDPQRRERFFRGARVMMELEHPAVVRVHDPKGKDDAFYYFVMELLLGGNLRNAVLGKRVDRERRLSLILQVGDALAEAHRKGLVHRDVKPANILLDADGNAKLTDFDLVGANDTTGGTRTGALGTVVYAAPECLDKPQEATARADVFGLGMTAIFCLSGRDLSMETFRDPMATVAGLDCSLSIRRVLERAVAWKPFRRFVDAAAMVVALREAEAKIVLTPRSTEPARIGNIEGASSMEPARRTKGATQPARPGSVGRARAGMRPDEDDASTSEYAVEEHPRWAVASGKDEYGIWAAFEVKGVQQRMRWIPSGTFVMGSPETEVGRDDDEGPQHEVTLTRGYWLGETPVTQALWLAVMGENPSRFRGDRPEERQRPVEHVSWEDCQVFLQQLNAQARKLVARLPTEAEWERGCRAGATGATSVDELRATLDAAAWYGSVSGGKTHPVGKKAPNPYGLYDMLGNVWEWCADAEMRTYTAEPVTDPMAGGSGAGRVFRGGSWAGVARTVRAAHRDAGLCVSRSGDLGLRLAVGTADGEIDVLDAVIHTTSALE